MTETVKPAHKRGGKREGPATARNASALLVNPLDSQHIVGVEGITLPGGVPVISARTSFDGGTCWKESWPLPAETEWAGVVGPVLAMDAHGTLNLAALAWTRTAPALPWWSTVPRMAAFTGPSRR